MKTVHVLYIEDNEGDIMLTTEALGNIPLVKKISVARDGKEAIHFFENSIRENASLPNLILLDINLPKMNGHEVLQFIKENEKIKHIPVIMLTSSSSKSDIKLSYKNHVNCYMTKPIDAEELAELISGIEHFWFNLAILPSFN